MTEPQASGWYEDSKNALWRCDGRWWWRFSDGAANRMLWEDAHHYGPFVPLVAINPDDPNQVDLIGQLLMHLFDTSWAPAEERARRVLRALVEGAQQ